MKRPLVRSAKGMVHAADCGLVGSLTKPWEWADERTEAEIRTAGAQLGIELQFCRVCLRGWSPPKGEK